MKVHFVFVFMFAFGLNMAVPRAETGHEVYEKIKKQQSALMDDIEIYNTRLTHSEKVEAKEAFLKDLGLTVKVIHAALAEKKIDKKSELFNSIAELLIKVDEFDNSSILLGDVYDDLQPYADTLKLDASKLLKAKKVTQKNYDSFMTSLSRVEEGIE